MEALEVVVEILITVFMILLMVGIGALHNLQTSVVVIVIVLLESFVEIIIDARAVILENVMMIKPVSVMLVGLVW